MAKWGIDVSKWQNGFDFTKLEPEFVIIKAGGSDDGLYMDSKFLHNYTIAKNAGLPCGLYWYTRAKSVIDLKTEIDYLIKNIKGLQFELPIFLDLEESVLYNFASTLAETWLNTLPDYGYYPSIYTAYSWWVDTLKNLSCDPIQKWLALWVDDESPDYDCGVWQNGHITYKGMEIDSDYMYADYSFIKKHGLNGFKEKQYFTDVTQNMSDYKAIQYCAEHGYIKGYKDGTYRPSDPVTRGQLATVIYRVCKNAR